VEQTPKEVGPPLVADSQAAAAQEPGERALDHPPVPAQPLARLDAAAGDPGRDAAPAEGPPQRRVVVPLVAVELGRALAGSSRFAARADDGRDRVDQGEQLGRIVGAGRRQANRGALVGGEVALTERYTIPICLGRCCAGRAMGPT
jgi:hypothetical protein